MNFGIIYKAVNKVNGKIYIGQTVEKLSKRRYRHENSTVDYYFRRAIKKYSKENFDWEILEHCDSKEELDEMEFHYVKQYNSFSNGGYNLSYGGNGSFGRKLSKKTKMKIAKKALGRKVSIETRKKISNANKGRKLSYEARTKQLTNIPKGSDHVFFRVFGPDNPTSKKYVITDLNGNEFVIKGIRDFCRKYNLCASHLVKCAKKKRNHHKGYKCRYHDEYEDKGLMEV